MATPPRKRTDLFEQVTAFSALLIAARKAVLGKRKDFALFNDDPAVLVDWRVRIERYLEGRRLKLHPRKTVILATSEPSTFLGFALHAGSRKHSGDKAGRGQRRLPEDNVARFRNRLRGLRDRWRAGTASKADVEARIGAWIAHADHADTFWLKQTLFEAGWFEQVPGMR